MTRSLHLDSLFSVWIGLMSRTTTRTLRTASVFAISSPSPEDPETSALAEVIQHAVSGRTSCDYHNLFTPVESWGSMEETALVAVETRVPSEEPCGST